MDKNSYKLAKEWLFKAQNDFTSAKLLTKAKGPPDTICFLCHQTVEKLLKGYLVLKKKRFEKIHDLVLLGQQAIQFDKELTDILDSCEHLNPYYIEARYPVHPLPLPRKSATAALKKAELVMETLEPAFA